MFGDGKSPSEILQVLSRSVQQLINSGASSIVRLYIKIDPTQFYAIERFTSPSGQPTASTSGVRWITDMGGKIISQSGNQVVADIPINKINDLASLPMFLYFDTTAKMNAADIKAKALPSQIIPSAMRLLRQEQFGLPIWSWFVIVGGLGVIWFSIRKRRTSL
jgi:hypothetical protein